MTNAQAAVHALARLVVSRPRSVIVAALVLAGLAILALTRVSFDNSTERLLVRDSEGWSFLESVRKSFGGDETLFVIVRAPNGLDPEFVLRLRAITAAVAAVPEVERAFSVATLPWPWSKSGDVIVAPLYDDAGRAEAGAPVEQALEHPLVASSLVSRDHTLAAVLALVSPHPEDPRFKGRLIKNVSDAVAAAAPGTATIIGGAPAAQVALNQLTAKDLRVLGPTALVVMAGVLFLTYGRLYCVLLPVGTVLLTLLWTVAAAALLGKSFTIVTSILPPLILAVGVSYAIRVLSEYQRQQRLQSTRDAALLETISSVGLTVVLCGATTALGFASLITSRVDAVRDLGVLATIGTGFATATALTLVPAVLSLLKVRPMTGDATASSAFVLRGLMAVHRFTERHAMAVVLSAGILVIGAASGLRFLTVDQDPYEWFPLGSEVRQSTNLVDQQLGGVVPLAVVLESPEGIYDPRLMQAADDVATYVRAQPGAGSVVAPSDYLRLVDAALSPENAEDGRGRVPTSRALVAQYLLLYETGDPQMLAPFVSESSGKARVIVRLPHSASSHQRDFVKNLEAHLTSMVPPPLRARVTGTGLLRLETNDEFTNGLTRHLVLASIAIAILLGLVFRSPRLGALALIPNVAPIVALYGGLGWLGIPLNAATVTTGAAALGNAVDDTVQYLDRYRRLEQRGRPPADARREAMEGVGVPMVASDLGLAAGFYVFLLSGFFPVASLGMLGASAMLLSLVANVLVLPVLVSVAR